MLSVLLICLLIQNKFSSGSKIIELDHDLYPGSAHFNNPGSIPFSHETIEASYQRGYWYNIGKYSVLEHASTTILAPYTFVEDGLTIDQIPVDQFFGEGAVIDIRNKVAKNGLYELSVEDVHKWVSSNGLFPNNSIVLINTGWDKGRYGDIEKYLGNTKISSKRLKLFHYPGISIDATRAILDYEETHGIRILGIGIDTILLDNPLSITLASSTLLAENNKYSIKNLSNLDKLPARGARIMVLPIKIRGGTGNQGRVFARLP